MSFPTFDGRSLINWKS